MAKNTSSSKKITPASKKPVGKVTVSTPVRNSAIPKTKTNPLIARKPVTITSYMIAMRAYEIHTSGRGGSETDNWFAAERALRANI